MEKRVGDQGKKVGLDEGSHEEVRRAEKQGQERSKEGILEEGGEEKERGQGERPRDEY